MRANELRYLTERERVALKEFIACLRERYADQVITVRLFGSKARGDSGPESDIDVLIVVRGDDRWLHWTDIVDASADLGVEHETVIMPLIVDEKNYRRLRRLRAPIYQNIRAEGVNLWTKTSES
jgi:predicted nucleotidyltransferase